MWLLWLYQFYSSMRRFLLASFLLSLFLPTILVAQLLRGTVQQDSSAAPVPFASVGVRGKAVGTVADAQGRFSFPDTPELAATDTVVVSCVGYRPVRLLVRELRRQLVVVRLQRQARALREVVVRHQQLRRETLGHTGKTGLASLGAGIMPQDTARQRYMRGRELGTFLTPARNCYVDDFNVYINSNTFREVRFRLLFYAVRDGRPAEPLFPDDVQFVVRNQQVGWTTVDLRPYNLQLARKQKIAVAIQWLDSESTTSERNFLGIPAVFPAPLHQVFTRDKSQAQWKSYPCQPSLYLTVQSWR